MPAIGVQMTAPQFEREMTRWAERNVPLIGKRIHGLVTSTVYWGITQRTPVLTSRARGNWIPTIGAPSDERGDHLTAGVSTTGEPATGKEKLQGRGIQQKLEALPLGQTSFITNNLDYIQLLENGSISIKSPPNAMVQGTINNTLDAIKVEVVLKGIR